MQNLSRCVLPATFTSASYRNGVRDEADQARYIVKQVLDDRVRRESTRPGGRFRILHLMRGVGPSAAERVLDPSLLLQD
jgi:hypothetical protein